MHPAFSTRSGTGVPIWFVTDATWPALRQAFDAPVRSFADASGFEPKPTQCLLLPGAGGLSGVLFGLEPAGKPPVDPFLAGRLPRCCRPSRDCLKISRRINDLRREVHDRPERVNDRSINTTICPRIFILPSCAKATRLRLGLALRRDHLALQVLDQARRSGRASAKLLGAIRVAHAAFVGLARLLSLFGVEIAAHRARQIIRLGQPEQENGVVVALPTRHYAGGHAEGRQRAAVADGRM